MNSQEQPLPPCPECGGERAWFQLGREGLTIDAGIGTGAWLYACTCLECGTITLRPAPDKMEKIRNWAKTQKPFTLR